MRLDLRDIIEIPGASKSFDVTLDTENLGFPSVKAYVSAPHAVGKVVNEAGVLHLTGSLAADMLCVCDRCGGEYTKTKVLALDATLVEEESDDDPELFVLDGDGVELDEVLSTLFILDMETKFLCREDCKGLCPTCGKNLNLGPCGCRKQLDPRFAVLEQLLDKK